MSLTYVDEKLSNAVHTLAVHPGDIKARLIDTATHNIFILTPDDFPEEIREKFRHIRALLIQHKAKRSEGDIAATVNQMTVEEAVDIADQIYNLAYDISFRLEQMRNDKT